MGFLDKVRAGIQGLNVGLKGGLPKFDAHLCNLQKGWIYTVAGNSGSGKTAFILYEHILAPWVKGERNVRWFFYSLEMSKDALIARMVAFFMKRKHNIRISSNEILSRGEYVLSEQNRKLIENIYKTEIEPLMERLIVIDDVRDSNPTGINRYVMNYAKANGTIKYLDYETTDKNGKKTIGKRIDGYTPNDPNEHVVVIVDHCGLMKKEQGFSMKQNIDKWVEEYSINLSNIYNYSIINVAQLNRSISNFNRISSNPEELMPQCSDIMHTSSYEQASHIVIGIFNPNPYKGIKTHAGYNLNDWQGTYRCMRLMKGREIPAPYTVAVMLDGKSSLWEELPAPDDPLINKFINLVQYIVK